MSRTCLQRLSFGLPLAVVFEVGIILTTPVLSQDGDCYYHPLNSFERQAWSRPVDQCEVNRTGWKKTHAVYHYFIWWAATAQGSEENMQGMNGVNCIFLAESLCCCIWRSSLWTLQLNRDGLQIINLGINNSSTDTYDTYFSSMQNN